MKAKSFARRSPRTRMLKLEPRILFDGALAVDLVAGAQDGSAAHTDANVASTAAQPDSAPAPQLFALAEHIASAPVSTDAAQQQIVSFLSTASAKDLGTIFSGAQGEAGANALSAAEALRQGLLDGSYTVKVELLDNTTMQGAKGAFAGTGPDGTPVIYLNRD